MSERIFISHRSTDKCIADILIDFFTSLGVKRECVFCSSLPGNDVKQKISEEVKAAINDSCLNIAILSKDYYDSAYCLNEAGVLWFKETAVILIALPEINPNNMIGFLNNEFKIRRLDNDDDIAYLSDQVCESTALSPQKHSIVTTETRKLKDRYEQCIANRPSFSESIHEQESKVHDDHFDRKMDMLKSIEKFKLPELDTLSLSPRVRNPKNDEISEVELSILFSNDTIVMNNYKKLIDYISDTEHLIFDMREFYKISRESDGEGGWINKTWTKILKYEHLCNSADCVEDVEKEFEDFCNRNIVTVRGHEFCEPKVYNYYFIRQKMASIKRLFEDTKKLLISQMKSLIM